MRQVYRKRAIDQLQVGNRLPGDRTRPERRQACGQQQDHRQQNAALRLLQIICIHRDSRFSRDVARHRQRGSGVDFGRCSDRRSATPTEVFQHTTGHAAKQRRNSLGRPPNVPAVAPLWLRFSCVSRHFFALIAAWAAAKPGDRHAVGAATDVVQPAAEAELDAGRIAALLAADADLQIAAGRAALDAPPSGSTGPRRSGRSSGTGRPRGCCLPDSRAGSCRCRRG